MSAAIEPMGPGERPTEPGWYVVRQRGEQHIMYALPPKGVMLADIATTEFQLAEFFTFIARIFPDQIGEEG